MIRVPGREQCCLCFFSFPRCDCLKFSCTSALTSLASREVVIGTCALPKRCAYFVLGQFRLVRIFCSGLYDVLQSAFRGGPLTLSAPLFFFASGRRSQRPSPHHLRWHPCAYLPARGPVASFRAHFDQSYLLDLLPSIPHHLVQPLQTHL